MPFYKNEKHSGWKGEEACASSKHLWINRHFGKANKCDNPACDGTSKHYEWANLKNHKHTRKRKDYKMMCRKCHSLFDKSKICKNGHPRTENNTIIRGKYRACTICMKIALEEYKPIRNILRSESWKILKFQSLRLLLDQNGG